MKSSIKKSIFLILAFVTLLSVAACGNSSGVGTLGPDGGTLGDFTNVGGHVVFGTWEQDGDETNGAEPLEWIVLAYDTAAHKSLIVTRDCVYSGCIGENVEAAPWATSDLRANLNEDFLNNAFEESEQAAIIATQNEDSSDKVFILSSTEWETYVPYIPMRLANGSDVYSMFNGSINTAQYLTRDNDIVFFNGRIVDFSTSENIMPDIDILSRPAVWVDASSIEQTDAQISYMDRSNAYTSRFNIVRLGSYEQDNDLTNGAEPLDWFVWDYDEESSVATLLSAYSLYGTQYDTTDAYLWEDSLVRSWCNNDFYNSAFTDAERELILQSEIQTDHRIPERDENGYALHLIENTTDYVYILSDEDHEDADMNANDLVDYRTVDAARATEYQWAIGAKTSVFEDDQILGETCVYTWMRDCNVFMSETDGDYMTVHSFSPNGMYSRLRSNTENVGVRPVIRVSVEALAEYLGQ